jgi:(1->4)-alpha-D-glucan 1-alpha-D-glucosylmutase
LLSRNDVGFDAARLGGSIKEFHQASQRRLRMFPGAMLATATHDHKRGEDLRARLAVLSELPEEWLRLVSACRALSEAERPDPADELMLYQMVVGAWPPDLVPSDRQGLRFFEERLAGWQQKALREAKVRTSWIAPNDAYENRALGFLRQALSPDGPFAPLLFACVERIAPAGAINGLVQTVLKMTVPGVPDFFQGAELWDFSLVDPDNRQPVDYGTRTEAMASNAEPASLMSSWTNGRIKQAVIHRILAYRRSVPELFEVGNYIPLNVSGAKSAHVIAFLREYRGAALCVALPRLVGRHLIDGSCLRLDPTLYQDTVVSLPEGQFGSGWRSVFSGRMMTIGKDLPLSTIVGDFPLVILSRIDPV